MMLAADIEERWGMHAKLVGWDLNPFLARWLRDTLRLSDVSDVQKAREVNDPAFPEPFQIILDYDFGTRQVSSDASSGVPGEAGTLKPL